MSVDDELEWPAIGDARPGARFLLGIAAPDVGPPDRGSLPKDFRYAIGTVGALAGTREAPYLVTAAHVIGGFDTLGFPAPGAVMQIGFHGNRVERWQPGQSRAIHPDRPRRPDGALVDAVAIPLPAGFLPAHAFPVIVDDALDLTGFLGKPAFMLIQRGGRPETLDGWVERVLPPGLDDDHTPRPQRIAFRFAGATSVVGDSGAPILAIDGRGSLHLLGLHYYEDDPTRPVNTTSFATAAIAVCDHIKLPIL